MMIFLIENNSFQIFNAKKKKIKKIRKGLRRCFADGGSKSRSLEIKQISHEKHLFFFFK